MFYIGVDLGQKHDYTAIAIVEKKNARLMNGESVYNLRAPTGPELLVRRVQRVALGTPYPRVAETIREVTREAPMAGHCALVVDATGVGAPVVDMLREPGLGCDLMAVALACWRSRVGRIGEKGEHCPNSGYKNGIASPARSG